jgi:peptidyl-prolyl cis-trans isomerase A (cyclophilin A)
MTSITVQSHQAVIALGFAVAVLGCARRDPLLAPEPRSLVRPAPDSFDVEVRSSRGPFVIRARREWSPAGVDRFHYLVRNRYFDQARFFRVIAGFVAQWGLSGDPRINASWEGKSIPDEPVRQSNTRGRVSYARGGPNTRSVQLYINLADNIRLDTLNTLGFPPIGEVISGMAIVDSLYSHYSGTRESRLPGPAQDSIRISGNGYLTRAFPALDFIVQARVVKAWNRR